MSLVVDVVFFYREVEPDTIREKIRLNTFCFELEMDSIHTKDCHLLLSKRISCLFVGFAVVSFN